MIPGGYSMVSFTEEMQDKIRKEYASKNLNTRTSNLTTGTTTWAAPNDYKGGHYDHFYNFFTAIRTNGEVTEDPTFGLRAAGAALLANESYARKQPVDWNPTNMKLG